ncbi:FtsK/SpoIIIE domain-containing protein [Nocardiopsis rhodophaea]|uniref:FtsK/SpoIIIE domain-containing protein n=1 Tax=Nocardiopsis rhodophaea TaxID=280238 RepID=A0ABN2S6M2_9ACTN
MSENTPRNEHGDAEVIDFPTMVPLPQEVREGQENTPDSGKPPTSERVTHDDAADDAGEEAPPVRVDAQLDAYRAQGADFLAELAERAQSQRPIVPAWAHSKEEAAHTLRWVVAYYAHVAAYQATRSPKYLLKLAARTPRGTVRAVGGFTRWVLDWEGEGARVEAAKRNDAETYLKLSRQRDRRVRARAIVAVLVAITLLIAAILVAGAPTWAQWSTLAGLVILLGLIGAPADRPLIDRAALPQQVAKLDSDVVVRAFGAIGISAITQAQAKGKDGITFASAITRDGPGWRADIDLPIGVTAADVMERRARLASALRRPLGCVWPEGDPGVHEGRLVLWVGDRDLSKRGLLTWALAKTGRHDFFAPVPFGEDPRGRAVGVPLFQHNVLIGSLPGQGKTAAVRVLTGGAALDPSVQLWPHELKGSGDLDPYERVSHRFVSGIDDTSIGYAAESMRLLREEVMRRAPALKKLPRDICPDKRITRDIADKRSVGLFPLVAIFDECQNLFAHPFYGAQAGEDAEFIIKVGRALGVVLILATQRPDKDSLPTGVSANVSVRFCLKVGGQVENDMILGTSSYKNGIRATVFRPEVDAGNGYLVGVNATPTVVRTAYLDQVATDQVAQRAHALRTAAGTLTGIAAGQDSAPVTQVDLLADICAVAPVSDGKVWSETVVDRLAELRPDAYGAWAELEADAKANQLAAALKPYGISTIQIGRRISGKVVNRRGIDPAPIAAMVTQRNKGRSGG